MSRLEPIPTAEELQPADNAETHAQQDGSSLRDAVTQSVRAYLAELDGQLSTDVYQMVLAEVEAPLLEEIMAYTRNNQTKASIMLGLNRGTLRKKLKQYDMISSNSSDKA